jgi:hypothetical protein
MEIADACLIALSHPHDTTERAVYAQPAVIRGVYRRAPQKVSWPLAGSLLSNGWRNLAGGLFLPAAHHIDGER